jgi:small subunit ribosomal protein S4
MIKKHKTYTRPKNLFDKARIEEDKGLTKKYGLKNKSEIWKADSEINRIRTEAKRLIVEPEKQEAFFKNLETKGLIKSSGTTIDAVLSLTKEDLLNRRLQTIVFKLNLAKTIKEARQIITHRKIKINDKIVTIPSYIVKAVEENKIKSSVIKKTKTKQEKTEVQENEPSSEQVKSEEPSETQENE